MGILFFLLICVAIWAIWSSLRRRDADEHIPITIEYSMNRGEFSLGPVQTGTAKLVWNGPELIVKVGKLALTKAMVYTSKGAPADSEVSCVDTKLKIGYPVSEPKGNLGYWPSYQNISPDQRANYLEWISMGRRGNLIDIGYAFIYFYGLERRAILEQKDHEPIIVEVLELLERYTDSRSFQTYLTNFIAYVITQTGLRQIEQSTIERALISGVKKPTEESISVALAWLYINHQKLGPDLAYKVCHHDARSARSVVLKRLPEEHKELFAHKFLDKFREGIELKVAKREMLLEYKPASMTVINHGHLPELRIPNVLGITSQFNGLLKLWSDCIDELEQASRQMAKGVSVDSREAYEALPEELRGDFDHPDKRLWDAVVTQAESTRGYAIVPISTLCGLRQIEERKKLTKKQSMDLATAAKSMTYALIPDPWSLHRPYSWSEKVAIVASESTNDPKAENSYHAATLMLELGTGIAAADGSMDREEIVYVSHSIRDQFRLSSEYTRRLEVYRDMLIQSPPNLTGLGKRIKEIFPPERRHFFGRYLIGVAAVDGVIHPGERKAIRQLYKAMELPADEADRLLDEIEVQVEKPPIVRQGTKGEEGEALPVESVVIDEPKVVLNMQLVAQIQHETAEVASIIGNAMNNFDENDGVEEVVKEINESSTFDDGPEQVIASSSETHFEDGDLATYANTLGENYNRALSELLLSSEWSKSDLDAIARKHGLMLNGLVDELNTWADEELGDYLIEGDGPYTIQRSLIKDGT